MGGKILEYEAKDILRAGISQGTSNAVVHLLELLGTLPDTLRETIVNMKDDEVLKKWLKAAKEAKSIEEFQNNI